MIHRRPAGRMACGFVKMGQWKGKQIIYSCVDLVVVFVPLDAHPFQMSKDLIWAVSKCTMWRRRQSCQRLHRLRRRFRGSDFSVGFRLNSLQSLHEYGPGKKGVFILSSTRDRWKEGKCRECASERRWEVMCDGGRVKAGEAKEIVSVALFVRA